MQGQTEGQTARGRQTERQTEMDNAKRGRAPYKGREGKRQRKAIRPRETEGERLGEERERIER